MARTSRPSRNNARERRLNPYPMPASFSKVRKEAKLNKSTSIQKNGDWENATCSVCMEYPHNAVLLLCSSYEKGCRPYMCGTSCRHSNCLVQYKKAYMKDAALSGAGNLYCDTNFPWSAREKNEVSGLVCPLCRGQVKGWTVVKAARRYLNGKRRTCMHDGCSYTGTYKKLCKHVKSEHPLSKPRKVDPTLEQKWKTLEHEREHQDVISTIRSTMPRSLVLGDYVIDFDSEDETGGPADAGGLRALNNRFLYYIMRERARNIMPPRGSNAASEHRTGGGADTVDRGFLDGDDEERSDIHLLWRRTGTRREMSHAVRRLPVGRHRLTDDELS